MKKICSLLIALLMLLSMCVVINAADVCYIGDNPNSGKKYSNLTDAMYAAGGKTIHLLADTSIKGGNYSGMDFVLDGGGHKVKLTDDAITWLSVKNATLKNVTIDLGGFAFRVTQNSGSSILTLGEGAILENGVAKNGGGVIVNGGATLNMEKGAVIRNCKSEPGSGGGVFINGGTFNMTGGLIENCTSTGSVAGVNISDTGIFNVSGDATIRNNKKADGTIVNLKLNSSSSMRVKGALTGTIGITIDGAAVDKEIGQIDGSASNLNKLISDTDSSLVGSVKNGKIVFAKSGSGATSGSGSVASTTTPSTPATTPTTPTQNTSNVVIGTGPACYVGNNEASGKKYDNLKDAIYATAAGGTIHLLRNVELTGGNINAKKCVIDGTAPGGKTYAIVVKNDAITWLNAGGVTFKNVTIDLAGFAFRVTQNSGASVLTLGEGTILENGVAKNGGGVIVNGGATLNIEKGAIIRNCKTTSGSGGGVFVNGGTLNMTGGTVTNNVITGSSGGGVVVANEGKMYISGDATITGNKKADGTTNNLKSDKPEGLIFKGALTGSIGISVDNAAAGTEIGVIDGSASGLDKIVCDSATGLKGAASGDKVVLTGDATQTQTPGTVVSSSGVCCLTSKPSKTFQSIDAALNGGATEITLLNDAEINIASYNNKKLYIKGNGKKITLKQNLTLKHSCEFIFENVTLDMGGKWINMTSTAEVVLKNGAIVENGVGTKGGSFRVGGEAIFIMEDGSVIKNSNASSGGALYVGGTALIMGGSIENSTATPVTGTTNSKLYISPNAKIVGGEANYEAEDPFITLEEAEKIISGIKPRINLLSQTGWKIEANSGTGTSPNERALLAIDDDVTTYWHSGYQSTGGTITSKDNPPFNLDITLPEATIISGIILTPRTDKGAGTPTKVKIYADMDGDFKEVAEYSYDISAAKKTEEFTASIPVKRIRVQILDGLGAYGSLAEIDLISQIEGKYVANTYDEYITYDKANKLYLVEKGDLASVTYVGEVWSSHVPALIVDGTTGFFQGRTKADGDYSFVVDLGMSYNLSAVSYTPRQDDFAGFWIKYRVLASNDGVNYAEVGSKYNRDFSYTKDFIYFDAPVTARYFKVVVDQNNSGFISCMEFDVYESYDEMIKRTEGSKETYTLQIGNNVIKSLNETRQLDVAPYVNNDSRTLIPLRGLLELMGATVTWNGDNQGITIVKGDLKIELQINYKVVYVTKGAGDTILYTLDTKPVIKDSRTFVPIRFVSEQLGYNVAWDGATQTVTITK